MFEQLIEQFGTYYGLDWLAFASGLIGMYLLTNQNKWGFALNSVTCCAGFTVSLIASQYGFVFYNIALLALTLRGFINWQAAEQKALKLQPRPLYVDEPDNRRARNPRT